MISHMYMQKSDSTNMNTVSKTTYSKFIAYGPALLHICNKKPRLDVLMFAAHNTSRQATA